MIPFSDNAYRKTLHCGKTSPSRYHYVCRKFIETFKSLGSFYRSIFQKAMLAKTSIKHDKAKRRIVLIIDLLVILLQI